jgi:Protein of unknown function (DUF1569)
MKTLTNPAFQAEIRARIEALTPEATRQWGTMTAHGMVCHLIDAFQVALAEKAVRFRKTPFRLPPMRWLVLYVLPIPKGKIETSSEFKETQPGEWQADRARLLALLDRFVAYLASPESKENLHPAFGQLKPKQWARLAYIHMDHHLRQFGV